MKTPIQTTKRVPRKIGGLKNICIYEKKILLRLAGEPSELQRVAHDMHLFLGSHPLIKGGKNQRKVSISHVSNIPTKVFEGKF